MALIVAIATSASAMNSNEMRNSARVMTDRMATELRLTRHQAAQVYNINLRYIKAVDNPRADFRRCVDVRNAELRRVLSTHQFNRYMASAHARWTPVHAGWRKAPAAPVHHKHRPAPARHGRR